jgi:hypothetical protein
MPSFSKRSLENLNTCDPRLRAVFLDVVQTFDCTIIEGHRDEAAQEEAAQDEAAQEEAWRGPFFPNRAGVPTTPAFGSAGTGRRAPNFARIARDGGILPMFLWDSFRGGFAGAGVVRRFGTCLEPPE